jgi:hypothetical protein
VAFNLYGNFIMIKRFICVAAVLTLTACASIVSKSQWPVSISSSPDNAKFTITNTKGQVIHSGTTPASLTLDSGNGYFKKAKYLIKYEKNGYEAKTYELTSSVNGWYFGNILFGSLIGFLIVDPLTGAMYKLPEVANVSLENKKYSSNNNDLKIISLNNLTPEEKARLVRLN